MQATVTYMNHNPKCREIIGREEGRVDFFVKDEFSDDVSSMKNQDGLESV